MAKERGWSMKVHGLKELEKIMIETLPAEVNRRVLLSAIRKSAVPMRDMAKTIVVKRSGALAESIGLKTIPNRGGRAKQFASVALAPMRGNAHAYGLYKSYYDGGNKAGDIGDSSNAFKISTTKAKGSKFESRFPMMHGHLVEFGFKHHSGKQVPPQPFLRPAFDLAASGFVGTFRRDLKMKIEAAAKKIYKKNKTALRVKR